MDPKNCYGCIQQATPAKWGKCMKAYPGDESCKGKKYKQRKDFKEWDENNQARSKERRKLSGYAPQDSVCPYCEGKFKCAMCGGEGKFKCTMCGGKSS